METTNTHPTNIHTEKNCGVAQGNGGMPMDKYTDDDDDGDDGDDGDDDADDNNKDLPSAARSPSPSMNEDHQHTTTTLGFFTLPHALHYLQYLY